MKFYFIFEVQREFVGSTFDNSPSFCFFCCFYHVRLTCNNLAPLNYIYLSLYELVLLLLLLLLHRLFSTLFKYILGRFLLDHFVFILPRGSNINPFGALLPALVGQERVCFVSLSVSL